MSAKLENRRAFRKGCVVPVDGKEGTVFDGLQTVDISPSGLGLVSSQSIPINQKIAVEIELTPEGEPVLVVGQVKWVTKLERSGCYRVGMSFLDDKTDDASVRLRKHLPKK